MVKDASIPLVIIGILKRHGLAVLDEYLGIEAHDWTHRP